MCQFCDNCERLPIFLQAAAPEVAQPGPADPHLSATASGHKNVNAAR